MQHKFIFKHTLRIWHFKWQIIFIILTFFLQIIINKLTSSKKLLGNNENEHGKLKNITLYKVKLLFVVKLF